VRLDCRPVRAPACAESAWKTVYCSPTTDADDSPALRVWRSESGDYFRWLYEDGTEFILDSAGAQIWGSWKEPSTLEDAAIYLRGPVLGFALRLRGVVCLHASALAVDGMAIAVVGGQAAGKSTTAAALACRGFPMLSDDVAALVDQGETFLVQPGFPQICLWPDSAQALFGSADCLPRITPNWEKRYLALAKGEYAFQPQPLVLGAIYILAASREEAPASVEAANSAAGLMELVTHSYTNYALDPDMRAREFDVLARVLNHVPVRHISRPAGSRPHDGLCDAILADFRALQQDRCALESP
jgi:hypothetical protein